MSYPNEESLDIFQESLFRKGIRRTSFRKGIQGTFLTLARFEPVPERVGW